MHVALTWAPPRLTHMHRGEADADVDDGEMGGTRVPMASANDGATPEMGGTRR